MTDYTELKRLAEIMVRDVDGDLSDAEARNFHQHLSGYEAATTPEKILALIAELETAQYIGRLAYNFDGYKAVLDERDHLKAAISTPESVFINMKAGRIAKISLRGAIDLHGEVINGDDAQQIEIARLKAEVAGLKTGYEAYERVNAELKAENEALRKDAELHQQIQRAAKELPFGWDITLIVEQCSGWVELTDPHGAVVELDDLPANLATQVSMAIDAAIGKGGRS